MDEQLQQLIEEVSRYEEGTPQRQKALNKLLIIVQQLPGIYKSYHQDYLEALNKTWDWFCRSIDKFEPNPNKSLQDSLVIWINGYLKWRVKDIYNPPTDKQPTVSLDEPIINAEGQKTTRKDQLSDSKYTPDSSNRSNTLDLLDVKIADIQRNKRRKLAEDITQFIEEDPTCELRRCCTRVNAECNCQFLAKQLLLANPSHKIADIARELNVSNQTIYSHWRRICLPLLQKIGVNLRID
ncbi:MAG: response regulator transcription factor [Rivularia sp. (in: Bacteria)]|nr:response regulator transcription factor [Rivularia sp. MS3]